VASAQGDLTGRVTLTNTSGRPLGYKIKTTSPEKYRVRPSTGSLPPGQAVTVEIHVSSGQAREAGSLLRDKFLVTAVLLDREDTPGPQLVEALRTANPDGQYRLRCQLAGAESTADGPAAGGFGPPFTGGSVAAVAPEDPVRQLAGLGRRVGQLVEGQQLLAAQLHRLQLLMLAALAMLLALLLAALWPTDQAAALEGGPGPEPVLPPREGEL
jgi:hypothetical protein